ncbi:AMP-binding protein [Streptomyces olivaceoviridis]|uniref:AMP-binding protein n=1 Tax=Streptomyces olivaceoviridis TaxID=1921 RepID=UPI0033E19791
MIFTSGSTGRPKPVAVTHASLASHAADVGTAFELTEADRVLLFTGPGFDVFSEGVFPTLLLRRQSGRADLVIGSAVGNRPPGFRETVGMFWGESVLSTPRCWWSWRSRWPGPARSTSPPAPGRGPRGWSRSPRTPASPAC